MTERKVSIEHTVLGELSAEREKSVLESIKKNGGMTLGEIFYNSGKNTDSTRHQSVWHSAVIDLERAGLIAHDHAVYSITKGGEGFLAVQAEVKGRAAALRAVMEAREEPKPKPASKAQKRRKASATTSGNAKPTNASGN